MRDVIFSIYKIITASAFCKPEPATSTMFEMNISGSTIYDLIERYHQRSLAFFIMSVLTTGITIGIGTLSIRL